MPTKTDEWIERQARKVADDAWTHDGWSKTAARNAYIDGAHAILAAIRNKTLPWCKCCDSPEAFCECLGTTENHQ